METRKLGTSGLDVTLVGLGCNNFGLRIDTEASRAVIRTALDLGITFFDTADVYGNRGGSETCLGQFLGSRRKDIVLASKFGNPMDEAGTLKGFSRNYIMSAVEASLKRLRTDWIDLYQMHRFPTSPLDETLRALDDLVKQGKVRYIGTSQTKGWQFVDMQWTARVNGLAPITTCMIEYSLLAREPERELIPAMRAHGAGLLPFYPLASGFLTGKYERGHTPPPEGRITKGQRYAEKWLTDANWDRLEHLESFASTRGHTMLELAFSWLAAQPVVSTIIIGATRPEQVRENAEAADVQLSAADIEAIDAAFKGEG